MNNILTKLLNNSRFVLMATVLLILSFIVWQISFQMRSNTPSVEAPSRDNIPEGFEWVEEESFGYLYPTDWPEAISESQPLDTSVLTTIQHPPLLYDNSFDVWVIAETTEKFKEGDIYNGLAVARLERNLTIYEAGFAAEDCGFSLYVFPSGENLVQLKLPTFCFDVSADELSENAVLFSEEEYQRELDVLFSITPLST